MRKFVGLALIAACSGKPQPSSPLAGSRAPADGDDGALDDDGDAYTNLEEYLNELAAPAFRR